MQLVAHLPLQFAQLRFLKPVSAGSQKVDSETLDFSAGLRTAVLFVDLGNLTRQNRPGCTDKRLVIHYIPVATENHDKPSALDAL